MEVYDVGSGEKPCSEVDTHGQGEELVAELLKAKYLEAEILDNSASVPYRETAFAKK